MKHFYIILLMLPSIIFSQSSNLSDQELNELLTDVSNQINEVCPKVIDQYITLRSTVVINGTLTYMYLMDTKMFIDYETSKLEWEELQRNQIKNYYCTFPEFQFYRDNNIYVDWRYSDLQGSYLSGFKFNNESCQ